MYGGTEEPKPRKVIDYRPLNKITAPDLHPAPDINSTCEEAAQYSWHGIVDCKSGYWQVPLQPAAQPKSAFVTMDGFWQYSRVPFGLRNAPAWFTRVMTSMIAEAELAGCRSFVDDLIAGGETFDMYV